MKFRLARLVAAASLLPALGGFAAAAGYPAYLDDRSTPQQVILSFYNAINRHEYVRAWSYFAEPPGHQSFDEFEAGYQDTENVRVRFGAQREDAALSHYYYAVPTVIEAETTDGRHTVYAGCYKLVFTNPAVLARPGQFSPIMITDGKLRRASVSFSDATGSCEAF